MADAAPTNRAEDAREARLRVARHLAELRRLHLVLLGESRALKTLPAGVEIEVAADLLEQYLADTGAFLENMRGRLEARLPLLRRGEPLLNGRPEDAPGHGAFWLGFSRLCAVLRRAARRAES